MSHNNDSIPIEVNLPAKEDETIGLYEKVATWFAKNIFNFKIAIAISFLVVCGVYGYKTGISFGILALLIGMTLSSAFTKKNMSSWRVFTSNFKWYFIPFSMLTLAGVITVASYFWDLSSIFQFGWWKLFSGNNGTIAMGQTTGTPLWMRIIPFILIPLIVINLPSFAYSEEDSFRRGSEFHNFPRKLYKAFEFGMIHMIMGIPLAVAMALTVAGLAFTGTYMAFFKQSKDADIAVCRAASFHTTYNLIAFLMAGLIYGGSLIFAK